MSNIIWIENCTDMAGVRGRCSVDAHEALRSLLADAPIVFDTFIDNREFNKRSSLRVHFEELELRVDTLESEAKELNHRITFLETQVIRLGDYIIQMLKNSGYSPEEGS